MQVQLQAEYVNALVELTIKLQVHGELDDGLVEMVVELQVQETNNWDKLQGQLHVEMIDRLIDLCSST